MRGAPVSGGRLEECQIFGPNSACRSRSTQRTVELISFGTHVPSVHVFRLMDLRLWLVASTCAGYDDDAQICCEHGGEEGQNVSLSTLLFFS